MRFIVLSLILFTFLPAIAQEFKIKKVSTAYFLDTYTVDKITKLKSGNYLRLDKENKDTLISGTYRDGEKSGIWRYFSTEGRLWISYNFDSKAFEILPEEISKIDSFVVRKGDSFAFEKVDMPPVYLGSKKEIEKIITSNFKVPIEICENNKSGISIATFVVDKNGKMKEFHGEQMLSNEVLIQLQQAFTLVNGDWSSAKVNGESVDSQVLLVCDIAPYGAKTLFQDNPKAIVVHFQYYGVTTTKQSLGFEIRTVEMGSNEYNRLHRSSKRYFR